MKAADLSVGETLAPELIHKLSCQRCRGASLPAPVTHILTNCDKRARAMPKLNHALAIEFGVKDLTAWGLISCSIACLICSIS